MKNALPVLIAPLFFLSCNSAPKEKATEVTPKEEKHYVLAYNIYVNDSIHRNNYEVFTTNLDGSGKKNITNHPDVAWVYYAYGNRLFFISDRDTCSRCFFLYESDANGQNVRKELVVTGKTGPDVRHQLFILDTKTGAYRQLTHEPTAKFGDPCFSPDGKKIAFYYQKNIADKSSHEELFIMNEDGTGMMQLTHYPEDNPSAQQYGYRAGAARWHPKENFISYVSLQEGRHSIFAVTPDGKKQWKLIDNDDSEGYHDWSPDGKWLAFNKSDRMESQFHIVVMDWETKKERQLTDTTYKSQLAPVFVEK
jgi:TolB protein